MTITAILSRRTETKLMQQRKLNSLQRYTSFVLSFRVHHADVAMTKRFAIHRRYLRERRWHAHISDRKRGRRKRNDDGNNPKQHCSSRLTRQQVRSAVPRFLTCVFAIFLGTRCWNRERRAFRYNVSIWWNVFQALCKLRMSLKKNVALYVFKRDVENTLPQPGNNDMLDQFE